MNGLFLKGITKDESAEILLQGFVFFLPFVITNQIERARTCIVNAFTLWNSFSDILSLPLMCRVYIHMLEMSSNIVDRQYWLQMIIRLGNKALTKENRTLLAFVLVFSPNAKTIYNRNPDQSQVNILCTHMSAIVQFLETSDN